MFTGLSHVSIVVPDLDAAARMGDSAHYTAGPVTIPAIPGWEDRTVLTMVGPNTDGAQPNVVVTREQLCSNMGLGAFSSGWVQRLADKKTVFNWDRGMDQPATTDLALAIVDFLAAGLADLIYAA